MCGKEKMMKKRWLWMGPAVLLAACCLAACGENGTPATYTVTFVQSGQEDVLRTVKEGETPTDIPAVQPREGYTVVWEEKDLTNISGNITVNAVETANTYTVTYDANGGTVSSETLTVTYDAQYALVTPSREDGYTFVCWMNGEDPITQSGTWKIASDVTLTAQWREREGPVVITFVQNGQENVTREVEYGSTPSAETLPAPKPKEGYTVVWDPNDLAKLKDLKESVTVNAVETPNEYTITYTMGELAGDEGASAENQTHLTVTFDAPYDLAQPVCDGYTFKGWVIVGEDGKQEAFVNGIYTIAGDITLTATWERDETADRWWSEIY